MGECERFRSDEGKWDGKSLIVSRKGRIQTRGEEGGVRVMTEETGSAMVVRMVRLKRYKSL